MKINKSLSIQNKIFKDRIEIRQKKAHDYAQDQDCLSNFKLMADLCTLLDIDVKTPYGTAYYMFLHKVVRECQFIFGPRRGVDPKNESLYDTICIDKPNYHDLFVECLIEEGLLSVEDQE